MTPDDAIRSAVHDLVDALCAAVRQARAAPAPVDRLLGVDEAAAMLGIGRTALYGELASGRLPSIKVGRRRLVPASAVQRFIDDQSDAASKACLPPRSALRRPHSRP